MCVSILTNLDLHVLVEEEVAQLEIAVDDAVVVEVLAALDGLAHKVARLGFRHGLATLVQLEQRLEDTEEKLDTRSAMCANRFLMHVMAPWRTDAR